jgi:VWFA-related protein
MEGATRGAGPVLLSTQQAVSDFATAPIAYNLERRTLITIDAMRSLSRMLGGLQGRKNVIWLTAELRFDLIPENRNMTDAEMLADLTVSQSKSVQLRSAAVYAGQERELHGEAIRLAEAQLASSNIAIYPVDLHGLLGGMNTTYSGAHGVDIHGAGSANQAIAQGGNLQASQGTMEEIAAETGGKPYINQNEIKNGVALAAADDTASYEIGYYPENKKWDGKYRTIKIKLAHGNTQIRYRKGYFAIDNTPPKNANYDQDVAAALQFNAPATQISFMAQAKPSDPGKVRVIFLVNARTVTAEDPGGSKKVNVSLYACIFAADGKSLATRSVKVDRSFDAGTYQQILDKGMMVPIDLDVPSGGSELRLAVLDNKTGYIGTVSGPLGQ